MDSESWMTRQIKYFQKLRFSNSLSRTRAIGLAVIIFLVQTMLLGSWCSVTMATPPGHEAATTATATNQSVTLNKPAAEIEPGQLAENAENSIYEEPTEKASQADGSSAKAGLMLPPRGEPSRSGVGSSRQFRTSELAPVPWYRSGVGALFIVLAVICGAYFAIRKWVPTMKSADGNIIKVLSRTSLSPKHQAVLVKVGKRMLLVGMTAENMTTLTELTDDDELGDALVLSGDARRDSRVQFETMLGQEQERFTDEEVDEDSPQPLKGRREPLSKLLQRLRQLQSSS